VWVWAEAAFFINPHQYGRAAALADRQWPALAELLFYADQFMNDRMGPPEEQRQRLLDEKLSPQALEDLLLLAFSAGDGGDHQQRSDPVQNLVQNLRLDHWGGVARPVRSVEQFVVQLRVQLRQVQPAVQQQLLELAMMRGHVQFLLAAERHLGLLASPAAVDAAMQHHIAAGRVWEFEGLARCRSAQQLSEQ
jgi:hypothetical protein